MLNILKWFSALINKAISVIRQRITVLLWITAFFITAFTAIYQRITGPTYPLKEKIVYNNAEFKYSLGRTQDGNAGHQVKIPAFSDETKGFVLWKRFKTSDEFSTIEMVNNAGFLEATLPHQPPAGKLEYLVRVKEGNQSFILNNKGENVVIRFKGDVPLWILYPHIFTIFTAMFLSVRTGMEYFNKKPNWRKLTFWTIAFLGLGGFVFGPLTQQCAFGALWTGFPFGNDLTDNKILIAAIGWLIALWAVIKLEKPAKYIIIASIVMFIVFLIPHSLFGSELDYNKLDEQNKIENTKK